MENCHFTTINKISSKIGKNACEHSEEKKESKKKPLKRKEQKSNTQTIVRLYIIVGVWRDAMENGNSKRKEKL